MLHMYCLGLRDIDINGEIPTKANLRFDVSGDEHKAKETATKPIKNGGLDVLKFLKIPITVPDNREFCPILEIKAYGKDALGADSLLGLGNIGLA